MSAIKLKVLIAGAGIAGPCLAYWLTKTRLDISITIIERSPYPRVTGQAIDFRGPAVEIIKKMGLEEAVRSRHTTGGGTRFVDSSGKYFARFDAGDTFTAENEILRADLSELFLEATEGLDSVQYIYGESVKSLEQTDKYVNVTFTGGSKDTFDLVVAADGSISKTRPLILDEQLLKDSYGFLGQYMAFFSIPSQPTDSKVWHWYNAPKGLSIMIRPHRNTSTMGAYLCITTPARGQRDAAVEDAMDRGTEDTKRVLHEYFDNAGWEAKRVLEGMDHAEDFYMSRMAQSSNEVPHALERFEDVFRRLYAKQEDLPFGFPQLMFPQTAWGLWLRDFVLWFVSKTKTSRFFSGDSEIDWELPWYDWVGI